MRNQRTDCKVLRRWQLVASSGVDVFNRRWVFACRFRWKSGKSGYLWELLNKYALNKRYPEAAEFARSVLEVSGRTPQGKGKQK